MFRQPEPLMDAALSWRATANFSFEHGRSRLVDVAAYDDAPSRPTCGGCF
jgi:hypothetical protein